MVYDDAREADVTALEKLAAELEARGFDPVITTAADRPALVVSNPRMLMLSETILVDGRWFWWSWAERIVTTENVPAAADAIGRVLARESSPT